MLAVIISRSSPLWDVHSESESVHTLTVTHPHFCLLWPSGRSWGRSNLVCSGRDYCASIASLPLGDQRGSGELYEKTQPRLQGGRRATPPPPLIHTVCWLYWGDPFGLPFACAAWHPVSLSSARHLEQFAYVSLPLLCCVSRKSCVLPGNGWSLVGRQVQYVVNSSTSGLCLKGVVHGHMHVCEYKHKVRGTSS